MLILHCGAERERVVMLRERCMVKDLGLVNKLIMQVLRLLNT